MPRKSQERAVAKTAIEVDTAETKAAEIFSGARALGIDRTLAAIKTLRGKRQHILEYEAEKAEETKRDAEPVKARLKRAREEKEQKKAEMNRQVKAALDATYDEDVRRVHRQIQAAEDKKRRDEAREKQRKAEAKVFEELRQERAESLVAQRQEKADAEKRAEAQRASRVKTVIEKINRVLEDDQLSNDLKKECANTYTSYAEKGQIHAALDRLESRVFQHKSKWQPR